MRFLHCADIHLDSPLRGLERYEGAPVEEVRAAPRRALDNLVDLAIREGVDFVLIAGDLYDGDWQDFNTGLFFTRAMARLGDSGIPAYVIRGNHDAASRITQGLRLPANVRLLDAHAPQTVIDENLGLAVHGQSFATAAVSDDLAAAYPRALRDHFNVGLLHTALTGREGHAGYAPTSADVLRTKGYDYWALGHVHSREIVATDPWIVFPGNLQGRHIRETGSKGCERVSVEDGVITTAHVPLDVLRWATIEIDIAELADLDALLDVAATATQRKLAAAEGRPLAVRFLVTGAGALHDTLAARPEHIREQLRSVAIAVSNGLVWVEKVRIDVRTPLDLPGLAAGDDAVASLLGEFARVRADADALRALADQACADLRQKLPATPADGDDGLDLGDLDTLRAILAEAESELLARLVRGDDE
ncbi:MAG: DNA repair exonuclease [Gammaproteobacteria bacterium]|nr:DNA repair exonuclease [Gammaproteobacteria bacterium]